jgi:predicted O-methyltransferase YrrM
MPHVVPKTVFPPGHFHSPIVNPEEVVQYYQRSVSKEPEQIAGVNLSLGDLRNFWLQNLNTFKTASFPATQTATHRYHYEGCPFPYGDAAVLRVMMARMRPQRVVEIGSGYSTACMLDAADEFELDGLTLTCIDPNTQRLRSLLRPRDLERITIMETVVQDVELDIFAELKANDVLLIDSTHVLKTGSDVHYEIFEILPKLQPGVLVHFHDCQYPFEYPPKWVFESNFSWNEIYALRAFLMYNDTFRIVFWGSLFRRKCSELIAVTFPDFLHHNPGGSIWLRVYDR